MESSIDPWGQRRDDWHAALIAHAVVRCHAAAGDGKVWGSEAKTRDFLLDFEPREEGHGQQTPEQQLEIFKRLAQIQNARFPASH